MRSSPKINQESILMRKGDKELKIMVIILLMSSCLFNLADSMIREKPNFAEKVAGDISLMEANPLISIRNEWNVTLGQGEKGEGNDIFIDAKGYIYLVGALNDSQENYQVFLAKQQDEISQAWNCSWGKSSLDKGYGLAMDSANNSYVVGYAQNESNAFDRDVCLIKLDETGAQEWNVTWGGEQWDVGHDVVVNSSDEIYVVGYSESVESNGDVILLKYDSTGSLVWNESWGGLDNDIGRGIAVDSAGGIFITGYTASHGPPGGNMVIMKYNSSGDKQWNITWGGISIDEGRNVIVDENDDAFIIGSTKSFGASQFDMVLVKCNGSGDIKWNVTWGGALDDLGNDLARDARGNIYLTGQTKSMGEINGDTCLVKLNATGQQIWNQSWGASGPDVGNGIAIDNSSNVYITGSKDGEMCLIKYNPLPSAFTFLFFIFYWVPITIDESVWYFLSMFYLLIFFGLILLFIEYIGYYLGKREVFKVLKSRLRQKTQKLEK